MKRTKSKLTVKIETVRALNHADLEQVAGGLTQWNCGLVLNPPQVAVSIGCPSEVALCGSLTGHGGSY